MKIREITERDAILKIKLYLLKLEEEKKRDRREYETLIKRNKAA